jgi:CO/xanthine dehydrogenase FAD-binding subunit
MALLKTVYQPTSAAEAAALLARPDARLAPLAGGSQLIADLETRTRRDLDGVVDLSRAGLDRSEVAVLAGAPYLRLGAMVTLRQLTEHEITGSLADGLLRRAAAGEGPVNLRNRATLGGVIAGAAADSELYAALLALDVTVVLHDGEQEQMLRLEDMQQVTGLITAVLIPTAPVRGGLARVARTPADRPIVAAAAVVGAGGERVVLCGVAARPVLLGSELAPPSDFKGSAEYRRAMIDVVVARALAEIE